MPNEQHLKRLSCCPRFCFVVTEIWTLFICNYLPIVACSEENNGSSWDMIAFTRETPERHWQVGNDAVLQLTCLRKITGVYAATLQTQYTPCYQGECVKEGQLDIDVICEDLLQSLHSANHCPVLLRFEAEGGLSSYGIFSFGEVYFIMTVYVQCIYRTPLGVDVWATGCITAVYMAVI